MKQSFFHTALVLACLAMSFVQGQTTNIGMLYISPETEFSTVEDLDITTLGEFYNDGDTYIYAGFNNDGVVDFLEQTGITRFIGTSPQRISGVTDSYLYNVLFDNSSADFPFHLAGSINVLGEVNFLNGIVDIDNYGGRFTFMDDAFHINTSDYSHVDGPVEKYGNTDFTYPIGDGGYYRFAGISAPESTGAIFQGHYFLRNSAVLYPHTLKAAIIESIDDQEYWTIKPIGTNESVLVTLSWREKITPSEIIAAPQENNIHIVRWDVEENMWVDEGGVVDVAGKTVTTAVNKYGVFTLARVHAEDIMPCDLVVYNAVTPNGDGMNDYFEIDQSNNTCAENIHVQIFNRWGVKVFETDNYGMNGNVFRGYSEGRMTVEGKNQLPSGTYFYILDYQYDAGAGPSTYKKAGYLYLNGN